MHCLLLLLFIVITITSIIIIIKGILLELIVFNKNKYYRVIHTCCKLTINEDVQINEHTGNDCFLYDLPDGTKGTTAEELEKADKEGYALLQNANEIPKLFTDFSGYRLRYFLLRKKEASQFVIKGVERNE